GVDVDGLDYDAPMLESLRGKLAARGLTAGLHQADMRDFALPRRYALVFIPFNSFGHNLTQADQLRTLRACREHLAPGGRLALSLSHPSAQKLAGFDGTPHVGIEYDTPDGGRVTVWDAPRPDRVEQLNHVERRFERRDRDGRVVETGQYAFTIRYVFK